MLQPWPLVMCGVLVCSCLFQVLLRLTKREDRKTVRMGRNRHGALRNRKRATKQTPQASSLKPVTCRSTYLANTSVSRLTVSPIIETAECCGGQCVRDQGDAEPIYKHRRRLSSRRRWRSRPAWPRLVASKLVAIETSRSTNRRRRLSAESPGLDVAGHEVPAG